MKKRRYPGVSPFTSDQKNIFFGRDNDIKKLQKLISLRKQVLLYSKSGIGKTSLLNAGVLPKFEDKFTIIKIRFFAYNNEKSESPIEKIVNAIKLYTDTPGRVSTTILNKILQKTDYKKTLWYYFKQLELTNEKEQKYILVFDQFEELFSYPIEQINEFKEQFYELTKIDLPDSIMQFIANTEEDNEEIDLLYKDIKIKTIFAIRSDRLSLLNQLTDKLPDIQEIFYELKPLDTEQAKQAIINPAKNEKEKYETNIFEFETQAVENIINALSDNQKQNIETTQLQIVCQRIENIAQDLEASEKSSNVIITPAHLPKFKDIFLNFYENAVKQTQQQAKTQKFIEDQLIRNEQRISLDEIICKDYVTIETLKILTNIHLLRAERNSIGGFSYELSHDTLIEPILISRKKRIMEEELRMKKEELRIEKERAEKKRIEKEKVLAKERKRQRIIILILSIAILSIVITFFSIVMWNNIKKENIQVLSQSAKLKKQKQLLQIEKNKADSLKDIAFLQISEIEKLNNVLKNKMKIIDSTNIELNKLILEKKDLYERLDASIESKKFPAYIILKSDTIWILSNLQLEKTILVGRTNELLKKEILSKDSLILYYKSIINGID